MSSRKLRPDMPKETISSSWMESLGLGSSNHLEGWGYLFTTSFFAPGLTPQLNAVASEEVTPSPIHK